LTLLPLSRNEMQMPGDPVDDILACHGVRGPWKTLKATGVANRIYATKDVVLRIAMDNAEAIADARTESVAAPVALAAGVLTPRLLAFDDSRTLVDRPYSLWERVHAKTLGNFPPKARQLPDTWRTVGQQLGVLHARVSDCPDPLGWLDQPAREVELMQHLTNLASSYRVDASRVREIERWIDVLRPAITIRTASCFLHNDIHEMNLMCARDASLRAVIDWGDAGWGDAALEFAQIPILAVPFVLTGYETQAPGLLGDAPGARIVWDKLGLALEALPEDARPLEELRRFVHAGECSWCPGLLAMLSSGVD
jgi:aminoglycoside phosphotransferase (APT) family kinase protein